MEKLPARASRGRGNGTSAHDFRQRLERSSGLYLGDCYARRTAARGDEYARYLGLTPQYFARRGYAVLGMPVRDFLRDRQLHHARRLLRATSYSTVEIAAMSAFGTPQAFYRAIKAAHGMTPGQYRKPGPEPPMVSKRS